MKLTANITLDELTKSQTAIYEEELTNRLKILGAKAIQIYEKALLMEKRVARGNWVEQLHRSLRRLREIYLNS